MPRDPVRTKLACLSAWVDRCEAAVRDTLARSPAPDARAVLVRCWATTTRARSLMNRLQAQWTRVGTRELIAAHRRSTPA